MGYRDGEDENEKVRKAASYAAGCLGLLIIAAGLVWALIHYDFEVTANEPYLESAGIVLFGCLVLMVAALGLRKR